uniref:Exportin-5 C-terminal domain-containing protein n=3 Tax=Spongospora subterranea TaxID=70186 RepID=A0A0H5QHY7_9EUKA|eukprot:CRZ00931.1 hypothetical protein [Spongospora subterranea]
MFMFVFSRIVTVLFSRLSLQWSQVLGSQVEGSIEREVFEENSLRECTRVLLQAMQTALSPHNWVAFTDHQPTVLRATGVRHDSACGAICEDPSLIGSILNILHMALQVPDSTSQTRAAALVARLLPYTAPLSHTHETTFKILETCLRWLASMTKTAASSSGPSQDFIGVCYEILKHFANVDKTPYRLMCAIPKVVIGEVDSLDELLRSSAQSTKAMRTAVRNFLLTYVPGQDSFKDNRIQDLPSHLVIPEKDGVNTRPSSPAISLPDLFP